jgi:hypothetical protein
MTDIVDDDNPSDRTLLAAWKRGELHRRSTEPAIRAAFVQAIADAARDGLWMICALALVNLRRHYDSLDPNDLPADERDWQSYAAKWLPFRPDRADQLIGRVAYRGGPLRCTRCGAKTRCACGCGAPYTPAHPWAAAPVQPALSALERARAAIAADPGKSNRTIAGEIGVSHETVRRARAAP